MSKNNSREAIDNKYKWDLSKIYRSTDEIDGSKEKVKELTNKLLTYKNHIMDSSNNLYEVLNIYFEISRIIEKLVVYSNMKLHEDMSISQNQVLVEKVDKFTTEISEKIAFVQPEILKQDYNVVQKYIDEEPKLKEYAFTLEKIFRQKKYTLDLDKEEMLARLGEVFNVSENTYEMLDTVDLSFDDVENSNGERLPLNQSTYNVYIKSKDRTLRKNCFYNYYKSYIDHKNTMASTLYGNIKTNFFISNTRGYKSPLFMSLYDDNISEKLYEKLITIVNNNLSALHDYIKLRKNVLNLDELHMYDVYVPLIDSIETKYTYEEATELVKKALSPLGKQYIEDLTKIINSNCIDVYHNDNKRTGAYSWGSYDTLPYVLLNFEGTFNDVSTIAHELGHSMHSYYSNANNKIEDAGYTIFLAEIASTVNEILLNKYCSSMAKTKEEKMFYLNNLMESLRTTLFRQTMFAEFEKKLYDMEQSGEILTEELISSTYFELNKKYYGEDIISDPEIRLEWARISHFYSSFYVYKYSTGISIACKIVDNILSGDESALSNYLEFLSSGEKDYSLNLLKKVGIDIENDDTIDKAIELFNETIKEFKDCL